MQERQESKKNFLSIENVFYKKFILNKDSFSSDKDYFDSFLSFIINNFNLTSGSIKILNNNIPINYSINIDNKITEIIYSKLNVFSYDKAYFIDRKILSYRNYLILPIKTKNLSFFLMFFSKSDSLNDIETRKNIIYLSTLFIKFQEKNLIKENLIIQKKIDNAFILNYKDIFSYIDVRKSLNKFLTILNNSLDFFDAFFLFEKDMGKEDALLFSFKSKAPCYIRKRSFSDDDLAMLLNNEQTNILKSREKLFHIKVACNEVRDFYVFISLKTDNKIFNIDSFLKIIFKYLNLILISDDNKSFFSELEKQSIISYFSSGILHYFNNFLQSAQGRLDLLALKLLKDNVNEIKEVSQIKDLMQTTSVFLKRFMFLTNNESQYSSFSFQDFIYDIYDKFIEEYGDIVDLEIEDLDNDYFVFAPKDALFCAIWEILKNSYEFSDENGANIMLNVKYFYKKGAKTGNFLRLFIDDIGRGMTKEELDNVFYPFYSTKNMDKRTKISVNLSGMGLVIAKNVINSLGGIIKIVSVKGRGTRVKIYIPLAS